MVTVLDCVKVHILTFHGQEINSCDSCILEVGWTDAFGLRGARMPQQPPYLLSGVICVETRLLYHFLAPLPGLRKHGQSQLVSNQIK